MKSIWSARVELGVTYESQHSLIGAAQSLAPVGPRAELRRLRDSLRSELI
jgi:hypothetical protein